MSRWGQAKERVRPQVRRCARAGCSNQFRVPDGTGKGSNQTRKRYCSKGCNATARKHRRGVRSRQSRRFDTCPAGHDRTPENTYEYVIASGPKKGMAARRCRICFNEAQRRWRERRAA